jgi:hypothetical protein
LNQTNPYHPKGGGPVWQKEDKIEDCRPTIAINQTLAAVERRSAASLVALMVIGPAADAEPAQSRMCSTDN